MRVLNLVEFVEKNSLLEKGLKSPLQNTPKQFPVLNKSLEI